VEAETLAAIEGVAWAAWLDMRTPALFEEWKRLWAQRQPHVHVPAGAWECP
jgi:hypothetical protein